MKVYLKGLKKNLKTLFKTHFCEKCGKKTLLGKVWQKNTFGKSGKKHFWEKCGKKTLLGKVWQKTLL